MITCLKCGTQNRPNAKFCQSCGANLSLTRPMSVTTPARGKSGGSRKRQPADLVDVVKRLVAGEPLVEPQPGDAPVERKRSTGVAATKPLGEPAREEGGSLAPLPDGSVLSHPLDPRRRYGVVKSRRLERSIYYDAFDLTCVACEATLEQPPSDGLCSRCRAPLGFVLIHERRLPSSGFHSEDEARRLVQLSTGHPSILPHLDIVQYSERVYTVAVHPGHWGVLVRGRQQRLPDEALAGAAQVGQALVYLHENGFAHSEVGGASIESLIVVGGGKDVKLADLSPCVALPLGDRGAVQAQVDRDVAFLGNVLFFLATNKHLSRTNIEFVPPTLRPFVEGALQGRYADVQEMMVDFSLLPSTSAGSRPLKPSHGQATHPGQEHTRNEDAVITFTYDKQQDGRAVPIGFYLVADGMGGHDAGDLASRTVNQIVTDWIIKTRVLPDLRKATRKLTTEDKPRDLLIEAIQKANGAILQHGQKKGSDLGSTVTAALVIGDVATVANVGDSRTYLLRDGRLEQVTQDHSLVARLVDAGIVSPDEVRTHPQRNQIYRCLGHKPDVEVDAFHLVLQAGDRLILCSDGLWEMVPDAEIQRTVEQARSPQKACDALVEAANQAGGKDNIAVIVVELE